MKSFLMLGQSNMAGRGDFGEVPEIKNPQCFMLRNGRFIVMNEPVNADRGFAGDVRSGIGLAASFADEYSKYFNEDVGLIPCADGGTYLKQWMPGEILYENAVVQAKFAQKTSQIAGILWHQGENDCINKEDSLLYRERFIFMMSSLLKELNLPADIPIIIGELGEFVKDYKNGWMKYYEDINNTLKDLSKEFCRCGFVSAEGLTCRCDGIHFDSKSYRIFGKRYFEEFLRVKNKA